MKIAFLSDGRNVHTRRWLDYFSSRGDETLLLTMEQPEEMQGRVLRLGSVLPGTWLGCNLALPRAKRELRAFGPDLVNAHFIPNYGWIASCVAPGPWVMSTWGSDVLVNPGKSAFHRWRARKVLRAANLISSDAKMLSAAIGRLAGEDLNVLTMPMGIDRDYFAHGMAGGPREPLILHNRNLERIYDVGTVLRGLRAFFRIFPGWRARLAGDGSLRSEMETMAEKLEIRDRVDFLGYLGRDELMHELSSARIYLSASLSDSSSVSLLEAMAMGAYPVLSDIPANREWAPSAPRAMFFRPGKADELTTALLEAAALPDETRRAALESNRSLVGERAIWEENMGGIREAFQGLLEGAA